MKGKLYDSAVTVKLKHMLSELILENLHGHNLTFQLKAKSCKSYKHAGGAAGKKKQETAYNLVMLAAT